MGYYFQLENQECDNRVSREFMEKKAYMNEALTWCRCIIHSSQTTIERGQHARHLFVMPNLPLNFPRRPFDLIDLSGFSVDKSRV